MKRSQAIISMCYCILFFAGALQGQGVIAEGSRLYDLKCGRCHLAYAPQKYSEEEWKTILIEMGPLSGLDKESEKAIMTYLKESASESKTGELPTAPVLGGYLYTEFFASPASVDTFDIHYLNVNLTGRVHDRISYRAEFEFEHGGGEAEPPFIEQAYMDVWFQPNTALRIGAILAPFNRFDDFHAPLENLMVTRPQMSREIGVSAWKEVGIDLHGNVFLRNDLYLTYDAYVINGLGDGGRLRGSRQYRDNNDAKSLGFRLSGIFMDRWEAGVSYYHGAWDDEGEHDLNMLGLHFLGRLGDFNLHGEYARARSENPDPIAVGEADGYFLQGSYLFRKKFRPSLRYGNLDYLDLGNLRGRRPTDIDRRVLAVGFNFYLTSSIVFKVEYDFFMEGDRVVDTDNDLFALQAAVRF